MHYLVLMLVLFGVGCTSPQVKYGQVSSGGEELAGKYKFRLSRSLIMVGNEINDKKMKQLVARAVPTDMVVPKGNQDLYTIEEQANWISETRLKVELVNNSFLVSSIGVEVKDNLTENLEKIGAVAGKVIGAAAGFAAPSEPGVVDLTQTVIDIEDYQDRVKGDASKQWQPLPLNSQWVYKIEMAEGNPAGAIETKTFFTDRVNNKFVDVFPYSACRDVTLFIYEGKGAPDDWSKVVPFQLKISDPKFVQTIRLPSKGKITSHSSCGVNVVNESETNSSAKKVFEVVETLIKQAEGIKKALDKKNEGTGAGKT